MNAGYVMLATAFTHAPSGACLRLASIRRHWWKCSNWVASPSFQSCVHHSVTLSHVKFKYVTVLISIHFIYMSNTYSLSSPFVQQQRLHMHFLEILFVIRCDLDFGEPIDTLSIQVQVCSLSNAAPKWDRPLSPLSDGIIRIKGGNEKTFLASVRIRLKRKVELVMKKIQRDAMVLALEYLLATFPKRHFTDRDSLKQQQLNQGHGAVDLSSFLFNLSPAAPTKTLRKTLHQLQSLSDIVSTLGTGQNSHNIQ